MKQRSSKSSASASASTCADKLNDEEMEEVAAILTDFPNFISRDQDFTRLLGLQSISWGSKRRRSVRFQSSPPYQTDKRRRRRPATINVKVEAADSPLTPLCFPQSESDDKSKEQEQEQEHSLLILNSTTISKKRKKKEWMEMIDELTQQKEVLTGELQNVKNLYSRLKAFNLELKSKKQKSSTCLQKEKPNMESQQSLNIGPTRMNPSSYYHHQISSFAQQHKQLIMLEHHHQHHQAAAAAAAASAAYESHYHHQQILLQQYRGVCPQQDPYVQRSEQPCPDGGSLISNSVQQQPLDGILSRAFLDKRLSFAVVRQRRRLKLREKKRLAAVKLRRCR